MPKLIRKGRGITERWERAWRLGDPKDMVQAPHGFAAITASVAEWARNLLEAAEREGRAVPWDDDSPESYARRINNDIAIVKDRIACGDANGAARFAVQVGALIEQARLKFKWENDALRGQKFRPKGGSPGPLRKAIAKTLVARPKMKATELWDALAKRPPRNYDFHKDRGRLIEGPKRDVMFSTFTKTVSQEKSKLRRQKLTS